jgi:hypothetical protein
MFSIRNGSENLYRKFLLISQATGREINGTKVFYFFKKINWLLRQVVKIVSPWFSYYWDVNRVENSQSIVISNADWW